MSKNSKKIWQALSSGKIMEIGRNVGGLYILKNKKTGIAGVKALQTIVKKKADVMLWHRRLGHVSLQQLKQVSSIQDLHSDSCIKDCTICPLTKQSCKIRVFRPY